MNYKCCALPSSPSPDDKIADNIIPRGPLPDVLDLRALNQPVRDQGSQGSCVAQACASMKEWQEQKQIGFDEYMSPQFIYNLRDNRDEGMNGRNAMNIILTHGSCRESVFKYGSDGYPPAAAFDDAKNYKIKQYGLVNTIEGLKTALYSNGPCLILFPTYNYSKTFWKEPGEYIGGHAVAVVGYNFDGFILRNSWGSGWGDSGHTIYPYDDFGIHWEIWTTLDDISPKYVPIKEEATCCRIQ